MADRKAFFIVRQHGSLQGSLVGERICQGRCDTGVVYEQKIQLSYEGTTRTLRRVTIELDEPTEDGEEEIHILTNLPRKVQARQVAEVYRGRWTIEGLFWEVSETLNCEIKSLCYPKAALFAYCVGLWVYKALAVVRAAVRQAFAEKAEELSSYYLAVELEKTYSGMMIALPEAHWEVFAQMSAAQFGQTLLHIASHLNLRGYRKTIRKPKKKQPPRKPYQNGEHVSTFQLLQEAQATG